MLGQVPDPSALGISKIVLRRGEKLDDVVDIVLKQKEKVIISVYIFESKEARDRFIEMWGKAAQMMQMMGGSP